MEKEKSEKKNPENAMFSGFLTKDCYFNKNTHIVKSHNTDILLFFGFTAFCW